MWNFNKIGEKPAIIGHRGARSLAPENTEIGILAALSLGLVAVEFDVDLTADGVPVVIHQETLEPDWAAHALKLSSRAPERAWVQQHTLEDLKSLDAGGWFSRDYSGVPIPTLDEILSLNWGTTTALMELKDPYFWSPPHKAESAIHKNKITESTIGIAERFIGRGGSLAVLSFDWELLAIWQRRAPEIPRILAAWIDKSNDSFEVVARSTQVDATAITIAETMALENAQWASETTKANVALFTYEVSPDLLEIHGAKKTVNDFTTQCNRWRALEAAGVFGITTDFPDCAQQFIQCTERPKPR